MAKFAGRPGDLTWGVYNYPVTRTQKQALEGLQYLLSGLPKAIANTGLWRAGFYSQTPANGDVILGVNHHSVTVHRSGRITSNGRR